LGGRLPSSVIHTDRDREEEMTADRHPVAGLLRALADRLESGFVKEFDYTWDGSKLAGSEMVLPNKPIKLIHITCSIDEARPSHQTPIKPNEGEK